ncbi:MAG: HAMP domain-containing sensor histidine kinase [Mycobacterium sp.]
MFGIPLALVAAHNYRVDERTELERAADTAAIDIAADLFHGRLPSELPTAPDGARLALYAANAARLGGQGPATADPVVQQTLADNTVHHSTVAGQFLVAVPIADGSHTAYAIRAATSTSEVYPRILATWALMLTLEVVILLLTWRLARWQAHRLARPLEQLAAAAGRLGDGDFSVRSEPSGIPEIDAAGTALNHTASRVGDLVDRERAITANTSHQLRTPLTGLRLGLEAALDSPSADHRQTILHAVAGADRLENTINDLTALARNNSQSTEPVPVPTLLNEIADTWKAPLAHTGRPLRITTDPELPPARASTAAVRQILAVLIDNAITHGAGAITVHARDANGVTAIDVTDEGTSMHHNETDLFHARTTTAHGLGLPLARSLAEADGGRLQLSSRNPTTFTVFLPTPRPPTPPEQPQPTPP